MNTTKVILIFIMLSFYCQINFGQDKQTQDFWIMLQTYSKKKDKDLTKKTISYLNLQTSYLDVDGASLLGFFGAIFSTDSLIRLDFQQNFYKLKKTEFKQLFTYLFNTNIDTIYTQIKLSPEYNDMCWASFFANRDFKFIDKIINNMEYASNRQNMDLFLTGITAKWSLCSNANQYKDVKSYLVTLKNTNPEIKDILKKSPDYFRKEMFDIINEQEKKGIWN